MDIELLEADYRANQRRAEDLKQNVLDQLKRLFEKCGVTLGIPLEARVKTWSSIAEKIDRKGLTLEKITDLHDLVGIRIILLFAKDIELVDEIIKHNFNVDNSEDTSGRLSDSQFGYQSQHYLVQIPEAWCSVPTMCDFKDLHLELQLRTLSQHIWAIFSHKLQYKIESNVPKPLRRSIHRISALLEIVDMEFDRILLEREQYKKNIETGRNSSDILNVDTLAKTLDDILPKKNKKDDESYSILLSNLMQLEIDTPTKLRNLLEKNKASMIKTEQETLSRVTKDQDYTGTSKSRIDNGVFFAHVGLVRAALRSEFGDNVVTAVIIKSDQPKKIT